MSIFKRDKKEVEKLNETNAQYTYSTFQPGEQFPPANSRERISKYKRMKRIFEGRQAEVYERATEILKDTPHAEQLKKLYIAANIPDIIVTKPADLLVGEPPGFETGLPDKSPEQQALNSYVEENDLVKQIHESCVGNGYRGDSWLKVRYGYRQDFSEVLKMGGSIPEDAKMEPIIEHVSADCVFPETSRGNIKTFKAVNIATVEYVVGRNSETTFLNVERHIPGYIKYERYILNQGEGNVDNTYGFPLVYYIIGDRVPTGREEDLVETGVPQMLVHHIPYKSVDDDWEGIGGLEKLDSILAAINDRLVQIDYILWKHSDPTGYGPDLDNGGNSVRFGGKYFPITKEDPTPGYMTWDGQLNSAFKELEVLLALAFQIAETPQWLFGTVLGDNSGGTGTSHTDSGSIKARFLPILSKVNRIRTHYDKAIRDALYSCQLLDVEQGDKEFTPIYPTISWQDGIPTNEKELAEIMQIRTGGKATIDVKTSIKRMDAVDDDKAGEIITRISDDEKAAGFVDGSIFNEQDGGGM
ncbi:phage portal protein [Peribacillus butanolivorans]|uniref:phage portal protein n=1 Tax=Peribacillus butanolivorans TaxID=421767 RepID=UPI00207D157B|nr:phage portal protein [Peribacillus butanolivorans]MCO0597383.1 phage portal protein [Peribacillus butanolivorans]